MFVGYLTDCAVYLKLPAMNLWNDTLELIARARARHITVKAMCDAAGVSTRWWYQMMTGTMKDPSVHKVQKMHDWLKAQLEQSEAA